MTMETLAGPAIAFEEPGYGEYPSAGAGGFEVADDDDDEPRRVQILKMYRVVTGEAAAPVIPAETFDKSAQITYFDIRAFDPANNAVLTSAIAEREFLILDAARGGFPNSHRRRLSVVEGRGAWISPDLLADE